MDTPNRIHEVFAYLIVRDSNAAARFYAEVFGAEERFRLTEPSGRIGHLEMTLGPSVLMLADEFPECDLLAPQGQGGNGMRIHLHVDDCDTLCERAVAAGAVMLMPPTDAFYGERSCRLRDPFGHHWLVGHSIEEVAPEEMQRRYTAMFAE